MKLPRKSELTAHLTAFQHNLAHDSRLESTVLVAIFQTNTTCESMKQRMFLLHYNNCTPEFTVTKKVNIL